MRFLGAVLMLVALSCASQDLTASGAANDQSREEVGRVDHGDLIVLELTGSDEEMGRQQVELMLSEIQAIYDFQIPGVEALNVPAERFILSLLGQAAGSTVFAATRSATVEGKALIGRNVDWEDAFGRRPPVIAIDRPDNGDLDNLQNG